MLISCRYLLDDITSCFGAPLPARCRLQESDSAHYTKQTCSLEESSTSHSSSTLQLSRQLSCTCLILQQDGRVDGLVQSGKAVSAAPPHAGFFVPALPPPSCPTPTPERCLRLACNRKDKSAKCPPPSLQAFLAQKRLVQTTPHTQSRCRDCKANLSRDGWRFHGALSRRACAHLCMHRAHIVRSILITAQEGLALPLRGAPGMLPFKNDAKREAGVGSSLLGRAFLSTVLQNCESGDTPYLTQIMPSLLLRKARHKIEKSLP